MMNTFYYLSLILIVGLALLVFVLLFFVSAPYGKFHRRGWGPSVRSRWAWMIMEAPSPVLMTFFFFSSHDKATVKIVFIILWLSHYIYRTFIYPFTQSGGNKSYPLLLVCMAFIFNCFNGFINGYGIFHLLSYDRSWPGTWQFLAGGALFVTGFIINKMADEKLRRLRKGKGEGYSIPRGWLFSFISSPHYFGEMIEWGGWAVMTWSVPGLAFFIFTFANLFPRAIASHKWYRQNFPDYPADRKAIIPFII
jgi:3-oxo-5-alpha-steroid 4-dehydrogenase 1